MVGPSLPDERRDALNARIRAVVVLIVAASGAMVAVQAGGSPLAIAGGGALGALVGYGAVRYLSALGLEARQKAEGRRLSLEEQRGRDPDFGQDDGGEDEAEQETPPKQQP